MLNQLLLLAALLTVISAGPYCQDADGLYPNPDDRTTFIECIDGQENFRRCPRTQDGQSYQVFDGRTCVEPNKIFTCPQVKGLYRYLSDDKQYYECIDSKPVLRKCPENTVFDGLSCVQPTGPVADSLVAVPEFSCPRTSGVFRNPSDPYGHTYYECYNGVSTKRSCPSYTASREGGYYQERMTFNGQNCVKPVQSAELRREPLYVDNRVPVRRQAIDYRCPGSEGLFQASEVNTWYECADGAPVRVYTCEPGQTLDISTRVCRGTSVRDEEVVVHRPETVVVESSPRVVELTRPVVVRPEPVVRETYYPNYPVGYGRRYRRNGRVETEDQHTGSVIVDTWNEGAWRWDRNMNGQRLPLPLVNEWVDYGWRVRPGYEPVAEVYSPPVGYVNDPYYDRRYPYRRV